MVTPTGAARVALSELEIVDAESFQHVGLYRDLHQLLAASGDAFCVLDAPCATFERAATLHAAYGPAGSGRHVLVEPAVDAEVVPSVAWHQLAARAMPPRGGRPSVGSMFVAEAIAGAFEVYLVGRLLGHAPGSGFLEAQVASMTDTAEAAGLSDDQIEQLLTSLAEDPDGAFAGLYALLVDAASAMFAAAGAEDAAERLAALDERPFAPLLHRFDLSSWVLRARAYGDPSPDPRAAEVDAALRAARVPLDWLDGAWVQPALSGVGAPPTRRR